MTAAASRQSAAGQAFRRQDDEVNVQSSVPSIARWHSSSAASPNSPLVARWQSGSAGSPHSPLMARWQSGSAGSPSSPLSARFNYSLNRSMGASLCDDSELKGDPLGSSQRRLKAVVEQDVQLLQNRLAKLKLEQARTKGDIVDVRKKIEEVVATQEQQQKTSTMKKALNTQVDYVKRNEAAMVALKRDRQAQAVLLSRQKMMLYRQEAVAAMRKEKEMHGSRLKSNEEERREKNKQQRETVRQIQMTAKEKREQELNRRCEDQAREREEKERLAAQLIAEEAKMIHRLKLLHEEKQRQLEKLAAVVERGPSALSEMPEEGGDDMNADEEDEEKDEEEGAEDVFDLPSPLKHVESSIESDASEPTSAAEESPTTEPVVTDATKAESEATTDATHEEPKTVARPPSVKRNARVAEFPKKDAGGQRCNDRSEVPLCKPSARADPVHFFLLPYLSVIAPSMCFLLPVPYRSAGLPSV